jgi:hypothetical protein
VRYASAAASGAVALAMAGWLVLTTMGGDEESPGAGTTEGTGDDANTAPRSLIGDPHTADVCSLTDPDALADFGEVRLDMDYGNFHRCDMIIRPDPDTRVDVSTYLRRGRPPEGAQPTESMGAIGVVEDPPEPDECGLALLPPGDDTDGVLVGIRVNQEDGEVAGGRAALCAIAEEAAESAAGVLNRGPIPRRSPAHPDDSLAWVNACELLDARALATAGLRDDEPTVGVGDWECEWSGGNDELVVDVSFHRDQPSDEEHVEFSGYEAIVEPDEEDAECTVFLEYREYGGQNTEPAAEMVRLRVEGERPVEELCETAEALTAVAAARLPAR